MSKAIFVCFTDCSNTMQYPIPFQPPGIVGNLNFLFAANNLGIDFPNSVDPMVLFQKTHGLKLSVEHDWFRSRLAVIYVSKKSITGIPWFALVRPFFGAWFPEKRVASGWKERNFHGFSKRKP